MPPSPNERGDLIERHAEAKRRRDAATLGSDEFAAAAQEVARIEVQIAARENQTVTQEAGRAAKRG